MDIDFVNKLKKIKKARFEKHTEQEPMLSIIKNLDNLYNLEVSDYLRDLVRCQKLIITFSKQNDFEQSMEIILISKLILKNLKNESLILGKIFMYPSFSFYYYKIDNLKLSRWYVNQTIKFDDLLTEKFPILHLHKLHHVINLHQLYIKKKEYKKCAKLFIEVFEYLTMNKSPLKYGIFDQKHLKNLCSLVTEESLIDNFSRSYFICIWENNEVEKHFLKSINIKEFTKIEGSINEYTNAFKDYNLIQNMFLINKIDYNFILIFFNRYDYYHFDTYKLLIIKKLISLTDNVNFKEILKKIISEKLNFKEPDLIINRL